jgi:hypothetical protein
MKLITEARVAKRVNPQGDFTLGTRTLRQVRYIPNRADCPDELVRFWQNVIVPAPWYHESHEFVVLVFLTFSLQIDSYTLLTSEALIKGLFQPKTLRPLLTMGRFVLMRNRPGGDPSPGIGDKFLTKAIKRTAVDIGTECLDHIIVGRDRYYAAVWNQTRNSPHVKKAARR